MDQRGLDVYESSEFHVILAAISLIHPSSHRERVVERSGTFGILRGGFCCVVIWYDGYRIDEFRQGTEH